MNNRGIFSSSQLYLICKQETQGYAKHPSKETLELIKNLHSHMSQSDKDKFQLHLTMKNDRYLGIKAADELLKLNPVCKFPQPKSHVSSSFYILGAYFSFSLAFFPSNEDVMTKTSNFSISSGKKLVVPAKAGIYLW